MDDHPEFHRSLKLFNKKRFVFIPIIGTSHLPDTEGEIALDQIIGMFYYDVEKRIFKQDYIVNVAAKNKEFVSYSQGNSSIGNYVRRIHDFYKKYGKNGVFYYKKDKVTYEHRYNSADALPDYDGLRDVAKKIVMKLNSNK